MQTISPKNDTSKRTRGVANKKALAAPADARGVVRMPIAPRGNLREDVDGSLDVVAEKVRGAVADVSVIIVELDEGGVIEREALMGLREALSEALYEVNTLRMLSSELGAEDAAVTQ